MRLSCHTRKQEDQRDPEQGSKHLVEDMFKTASSFILLWLRAEIAQASLEKTSIAVIMFKISASMISFPDSPADSIVGHPSSVKSCTASSWHSYSAQPWRRQTENTNELWLKIHFSSAELMRSRPCKTEARDARI